MFRNGSLTAVGASKRPRTFCAKEAETRLALFAIQAVRECGLSRIILCMDASEVVKAFKGVFYWKIQTVVRDIQTRRVFFLVYKSFLHS